MTSLDDRREAVTEDDVDREAWVDLLKGTWEEKRSGLESFASKKVIHQEASNKSRFLSAMNYRR